MDSLKICLNCPRDLLFVFEWSLKQEKLLEHVNTPQLAPGEYMCTVNMEVYLCKFCFVTYI
jgi:hypothetical protein